MCCLKHFALSALQRLQLPSATGTAALTFEAPPLRLLFSPHRVIPTHRTEPQRPRLSTVAPCPRAWLLRKRRVVKGRAARPKGSRTASSWAGDSCRKGWRRETVASCGEGEGGGFKNALFVFGSSDLCRRLSGKLKTNQQRQPRRPSPPPRLASPRSPPPRLCSHSYSARGLIPLNSAGPTSEETCVGSIAFLKAQEIKKRNKPQDSLGFGLRTSWKGKSACPPTRGLVGDVMISISGP